jgi:hypothetical protein
MKTFAQLKRDLVIGKTLTMTFNALSESSETINGRLNKPRYIVGTQTNGITLSETATAPKGSFLELPRASLVKYEDNTITVYDPGIRELNADEQRILNGMPGHQKDAETLKQAEMDMMTDGNRLFYKDQAYLKANGAGWYYRETAGKYYMMSENKMRDASIKGKISIIYQLN